MQPSGTGGSDGSADDEGPAAQVSTASFIPLLLNPAAVGAEDEVLSVCCSTCRSQVHPGECRLRSPETPCMVRLLVLELEQHYLTAKADMMLAARTKPIHGVTSLIPTDIFDE